MKTIVMSVMLVLIAVTVWAGESLNEILMRERAEQSGSAHDRRALEMMRYQREAVEKGETTQRVIPIFPVQPRAPLLPIPPPKLLPKPQ